MSRGVVIRWGWWWRVRKSICQKHGHRAPMFIANLFWVCDWCDANNFKPRPIDLERRNTRRTK